jgi:hypothetical protein
LFCNFQLFLLLKTRSIFGENLRAAFSSQGSEEKEAEHNRIKIRGEEEVFLTELKTKRYR